MSRKVARPEQEHDKVIERVERWLGPNGGIVKLRDDLKVGSAQTKHTRVSEWLEGLGESSKDPKLVNRVHTYIYELSRMFVNHKKGLEDEEINSQVAIL